MSHYQNSPRSGGAVRAICLLYAVFFLLWCAGLLLGLGQGRPVMLFGLPLWFSISCVLAFVVVSVALVLVARRYFR